MSDVVIRCDASARIGLGHLSRSIALARAVRVDCGLEATLLVRHDEAAREMVGRSGVRTIVVPEDDVAADDAVRAAVVAARALVLDYRDHLDDAVLDEAARRGVIVATIDDPTPRRLRADLAFYPPIPQLADWDWTGFRGELLAGWEWVVMRRDLGAVHADRMSDPPRLLVSMGGSDPQNMTSTALRALTGLATAVDATVVLGPANPHRGGVVALARDLGVRCLASPPNFAELVRDSDLALVSFGVTAYELAACRVPALYMCLTDDHARSASVFEQVRVGSVIGTHPDLPVSRVAARLQDALLAYRDAGSWLHRLPTVVDGAGATRVARRIAAALRGS